MDTPTRQDRLSHKRNDKAMASLPNELVLAIIASVHDVPTLAAVARTCRSLYKMTLPFLHGKALDRDDAEVDNPNIVTDADPHVDVTVGHTTALHVAATVGDLPTLQWLLRHHRPSARGGGPGIDEPSRFACVCPSRHLSILQLFHVIYDPEDAPHASPSTWRSATGAWTAPGYWLSAAPTGPVRCGGPTASPAS
ncbi:ankyrin unc44 [Colletotrichum tofieldiae]|nr:ankyrin unc44 [Colletotrichum tofieldiae]